MGVNSIMNDAGRIGFVIKGTYDNTATYDFLDVVYFNNATYVAKKLTVGNAPQNNNEFWQVLVSSNVDFDNVAPSFVQAEARANINSGEKISILFGKIKKYFADLKTVAFTGSYTDLSNKPTASDIEAVATSQVLDTAELISANTAGGNVAGALALKEVISDVDTKMTLSGKPFSGNLTPNEIFEKVKNTTNTYFSWVNQNDTAYNPLGTTGNWQYEILNVYTNNVSYLYLKATKINTGEQWIYTKAVGWVKTSLGNKKYGTLTVVNANGKEYSYVRSIGGEFGVLKITCLIPAIEAWGESIIYTSDIKPTNEIVFMVVNQDTREAVRCLFNTSGQVIAQAKGKAFAGGWVGGSCTFM